MAAPKTIATYDLNGSTREFDFAFDYLARSFVKVSLIGTERVVLQVGTDYTFVSANRIRTNVIYGAPDYQKIEIRRETSTTDRLVDFQDASILRADDLDLSQLQVLHVAEEARNAATESIGINSDGNLDARGRRIVNLGSAFDPTDAAEYGRLPEIVKQAEDAAAAAELAQQKAEAAGLSAGSAYRVFAKKSDANFALSSGTIVDGQYIEVNSDESNAGYRIRYKVIGGILVFERRVDDATGVSYARAGRTVFDRLREVRSSGDYEGASALEQINSAIADTPYGTLRVPPGTYNFDGDIHVVGKNRGGGFGVPEGCFVLDMTGVRFTGTGRLIIDSCKRIEVIGLDAPRWDMSWRGVWWSSFRGMRYRELRMSDAPGTYFSSSYWNTIYGGQSQVVRHYASATSPSNAMTWIDHSMRGNAGQGFEGTAAIAFDFISGQNCQNWKFIGGDISYHTDAVYRIAPSNTSGDVEVLFSGVYFDLLLPEPTSRNRARIVARDCHHANGLVYAGTISQFGSGSVDMYRSDRAWKTDGTSVVNLIPNGDFNIRMRDYVGPGRPIGSAGGSVVTPMEGGLSGTYLNIKSTNTTSNSVRFRSKPLPAAGRATATVIARAQPGSGRCTLAFASLNPGLALTNEWKVFRITTGTEQAAGSVMDLLVYSHNVGDSYNVDIAYVGITLGEGGPMDPRPRGRHEIEWFFDYDIPNVQPFNSVYTDVDVAGARVGDFVSVAALTGNTHAFIKTADVIGDDLVRVRFTNVSTTEVDLPLIRYQLRLSGRNM